MRESVQNPWAQPIPSRPCVSWESVRRCREGLGHDHRRNFTQVEGPYRVALIGEPPLPIPPSVRQLGR